MFGPFFTHNVHKSMYVDKWQSIIVERSLTYKVINIIINIIVFCSQTYYTNNYYYLQTTIKYSTCILILSIVKITLQ